MKPLKSILPITLMNEMVLVFITCKLPANVPIHINAAMEVDRFGSKWMIVIMGMIPVVVSGGTIFYRHVTKHNRTSVKNDKVENILIPVITAFLTAVTWLPVLLASQHDVVIGSRIDIPLDFIIIFPMGVLMMIIGNFLGIIKQNRWLGIRTWWTLANETVWKKTHRFGGYTCVTGGMFMCICSVLGFIFKESVLSVIGVTLGIFLVAVVPSIYSYIIYKKER